MAVGPTPVRPEISELQRTLDTILNDFYLRALGCPATDGTSLQGRSGFREPVQIFSLAGREEIWRHRQESEEIIEDFICFRTGSLGFDTPHPPTWERDSRDRKRKHAKTGGIF
jgi:hypothetical protein